MEVNESASNHKDVKQLMGVKLETGKKERRAGSGQRNPYIMESLLKFLGSSVLSRGLQQSSNSRWPEILEHH